MVVVDELVYGKIRFTECCCANVYVPSLACRLDGVMARANHEDGMHKIMEVATTNN